MATRPVSKLDPKKRYLQVALNGTLDDARSVIDSLPISDRILVEAGTPIIKRYGEYGIRQIRDWYEAHLNGGFISPIPLPAMQLNPLLSLLVSAIAPQQTTRSIPAPTDTTKPFPYVIADLKTMDRGQTEVEIAVRGGASAAIALGEAPIETLNTFITACEANGIDAMIDMMNVDYPLSILRSLKSPPKVVILHRGVDEERDNREKQIPLHEIRRIKGNYDMMISIAGGDTLREVQRSIFNDADIVVVWKSVYQQTKETVDLINGFLKVIK